jgi:hypothetical protein
MQHITVRDVLDDVVSDRHTDQHRKKAPNAEMRRSDKGPSEPLDQDHRRQKHENLIEQRPRQKLLIGELVGAAYLGAFEQAGAVTIFEPVADAVENRHHDDPGKDRERHPGRQGSIRHANYPFAAHRLAFLWLLRAPGASHRRPRPRDSRSRMICD